MHDHIYIVTSLRFQEFYKIIDLVPDVYTSLFGWRVGCGGIFAKSDRISLSNVHVLFLRCAPTICQNTD